MSLPENPITNKEKYLSVMAGQNTTEILPEYPVTREEQYLNEIARNGGGGGGDVTKEYVDEQDAKKADKITGGTAGNFAGLDNNGNITDSGKKASDFVEAVEGKGLSTNDYTNDDKQIVADSPISGTVAGTTISISDATDARLQSLVIKGRSEVSSGNISSVGNNGLDVTIAQLGQTSRKLTLTTGLPLLSVGSVYDEIDLAKGIVIKRCGYADLSSFTWKKQEYDNMYTFATTDVEIDNIKAPANNSVAANMICAVYDTEAAGPIYGGTYDNSIGLSDTKRFRICDTSVSETTALAAKLSGKILVYELETPVIIPLNTTELTSWTKFRTFEGANGISATDSPNMDVTYIKNTENGQAVADIQRDLQGQIDSMITTSPLLTLTAAGWDSTTLQQTVTFAHDTTKRNVIDITIGEMTTWGECSVRAVSETATGITFECDTVPETALTFKVTSMEVN